MSKNEITGDSLHTKAATDAYRNNYDEIFRKKKVVKLTRDEVDTLAYMNHKLWEKLWLSDQTDWYPDSLGDLHHSEQAKEAIQNCIPYEPFYMCHVDYGVHAYKIGYASDYGFETI